MLQQTAAVALAKASQPLSAAMVGARSGYLASPAFRRLPLGEVRPAGWLQRQLRVQADGLSGHLDEFWPDVGPESGWLGGAGESWERGPYFLDGLLPLAYLLADEMLKAKAKKFVDWTLDHQWPNGMFGPRANDDWWPRMVMLKALAQYHEVTSDQRVLPFMTRYCHYQLSELPVRPLRSWGKYRWQDEVHVLQWLFDRTKDPLVLQLAAALQKQGYDWEEQFRDFKYKTATPRNVLQTDPEGEAMQRHGVNISQALKVAATQYRLTGDPGQRAAFARQMGALDNFHGMPNGMFSCDEHLGGLEPQHGTELCSVVETMFSMEIVLATFGDAAVADRLEKIAYNALPGTFTDDMWAHQYDQQSNQIQVGLLSRPWTTNGPESNLYGLEPHFGCCTANFHQGWPKYASSLWMATPDGGLAATLYAPSEVHTEVRGIAVHVLEETDYPFRELVRIIVRPVQRVAFPLSLRVPGWATGATVRINGKTPPLEMKPGTFVVLDRTWTAGDTIELTFPMSTRVSRWFNRSVAVERGPLLFSLDPGESWVKLRDRGMTADWQVFPRTSWNYALDICEEQAATIFATETPMGARPFSAARPGVSLKILGRRLDSWHSEDGVANPPPLSPTASSNEAELLALIPYGAAKLRVTAFPSLLS